MTEHLRNRRWRRAIVTLPAFFPLLLLLSASGCRRPSPEQTSTASVDESATSEIGFAEQLSGGRSGQADRIKLSQTSVDDSDLSAVEPSDEWLEVIQLDAGAVTDAGAEAIARLPSVVHLRLRLSPLTDRGLKAIAGCQSIQILNLPHCDATAAGVGELAALSQLRNLRLGGTRLGAETAGAVATIESLRNVHLIGVPIDDLGLRQIASLPKLQSLYLDDSAVTQSGWDWLFETHPNLHVHVNQKHPDRVKQPHP
ncbi:Leucine Rich repeats (2 copies) [Stieleria maiorica]|uniref:Leucine Rich repeats (2 copies) n=1 Tax=Stieleria maiorica TaxID=2795974 RepID=A0A5B9MK95_9BACT|nr:hypothetical protein [Stieleria maiorica]QEG00066.1 Leucine Rich repeats (2 copies) [Stieleria maiorica]